MTARFKNRHMNRDQASPRQVRLFGFPGLALFVTGLVFLCITVVFSLLTPVHLLSCRTAEILTPDAPLPVRDQEHVAGDGYVRTWIYLPAPNSILYHLSFPGQILIPVTWFLRGGVDIRKEAETSPDFGQLFDGMKVKMFVNGEEAYSTDFQPGHLSYRTFEIKLTRADDLFVRIECKPGDRGNPDYDWAVLKHLRVEPSFLSWYLVSLPLLIIGGFVSFGFARKDRDGKMDVENTGIKSRLGIKAKLVFSLLFTLILVVGGLEAMFLRLARSWQVSRSFSWISPPGMARFRNAADWQYDPELGFSRTSGLSIEYEFRNGDLYMMGLTSVVRDESNAIVFVTDEFGFRNTTPPGEARVAVLGDSFTEAANVSRPFPDRLASRLGVPVYNLGVACYGTLHEEIILQRMLSRLDSLKAVVLAWYGSNDPFDNDRFYKARKKGDLAAAYDEMIRTRIMSKVPDSYFLLERVFSGRVLIRLFPQIQSLSGHFNTPHVISAGSGIFREQDFKENQERTPGGWNESLVELGGVESAVFSTRPDGEFNSFDLSLGDEEKKMALFFRNLEDLYLGEQINSSGLAEGLLALSRISKMLREKKVELLVVYFPCKYQVYHEALARSYKDEELGWLIASLGDRLRLEMPEQVLAKINAGIDAQANRLRNYCENNGIAYLDLTPGFRDRAFNSLLYYENDTHFNEQGHELAAQIIALELDRLMHSNFPPIQE
jgi:hypothetical protein